MGALVARFPEIDMSMRTDRHRWQHEVDWTLESGPDDAPSSIDVTVPYSFSGGSSDYWSNALGAWHPGDPVEIETGTAFYFDDHVLVEVNLTDEERERVELHIAENPPEPDYWEDY